MSEILRQPAGDMAEDKKPGEIESPGRVEDRVPRVSIGLPVFNGEDFLEQALDSLLGQTFKDFELIISDNGSTDRTAQICRSYAARDKRIRYFHNETNRGASWNFNRVFMLARGEYFKWAAHDDLCAPSCLEECVSALDRDPGIVLSYPWTQMIDMEGRLRQTYQSLMTRVGSPLPYQRFHSVICQNRHCHEVFGLTRTAVMRRTPLLAGFTGSDRVLLADLALHGRFHEVPAYLFLNRNHPARSVKAYPLHLYAVWFDPRLKGKITFPHWRYLLEYSRTVARSELDGRERMRCYAQLLPWVAKFAMELAADFRTAGMSMLRMVSPRAGEVVSRLVHEGPRVLFAPTNRVQGGKSQRKA